MNQTKLDRTKLYTMEELAKQERALLIFWLREAYEEGGVLSEINNNHDGFLPHVSKGDCRAKLSTENLMKYLENALAHAGGEEAPPVKVSKAAAAPVATAKKTKTLVAETQEPNEEGEAAEDDDPPVWKIKAAPKEASVDEAPARGSDLSSRLEARLKELACREDVEKVSRQVDACATLSDVADLVRAEIAPIREDLVAGFNALHRGQAQIRAGLVELGDVAGAAGELIAMKMDEDLEDYIPLFGEDEDPS